MLVAFEGIDGSGLSTHSRLAVDRLSSMGFRSCLWKEPTRGPIGLLIRSLLKGSGASHEVIALLFAADRMWGIDNIECCGVRGLKNALSEGCIVVFDRYKYSSLAYQGALTGDMEWVANINSKTPEADAIIFIDVPIEVSMRRVKARGSREAFERPEVLSLVREAYDFVLREAERKGVEVYRVKGVTPDGEERSIDDVSREIVGYILSLASRLGLEPEPRRQRS